MSEAAQSSQERRYLEFGMISNNFVARSAEKDKRKYVCGHFGASVVWQAGQ